jgi:signal transduction histidine kinase
MGPSSRRYGQQVLQLAEELADRAAVFLDNARLYQDIQEADARKNEFLAMLAHELRNPLAAIRNAVQVLGLSDMAESQRSWARAIIDRQVTQLVRLVDDLLDVARITQGKIRLQMESVDLTAVVDLAVELSSPLIKARHHQLLVSCKKDPLWIKGDSTRPSTRIPAARSGSPSSACRITWWCGCATTASASRRRCWAASSICSRRWTARSTARRAAWGSG